MFDALYARGEAAAEVTDAAWIRAMCDVEAALARALSELGEIPRTAADAIATVCAEPASIDPAVIQGSLAADATPVTGLVAELRERVGPAVADHVHAGATSQDVVDTALMLVVARALGPLRDDVAAAADACARLADAHRHTPMIGRTLLQQALPTTFGLHAAGWLDGLTQVRIHLRHVAEAELAVQMGGPVGGRSPAVGDAVAARLGLTAPTIGWATNRVRTALVASVLGVLGGLTATIARDVTLLSQAEIGELAEGRAGGSSAMAHKQNPVASVATLACCGRIPGLVAASLAAGEQELQRAAGAWQSEWGTLCELLTLTGSATAWVRALLEDLRVDAERMAANLAAAPTGDRPLPDGVGALVDRALAAHRGAAP